MGRRCDPSDGMLLRDIDLRGFSNSAALESLVVIVRLLDDLRIAVALAQRVHGGRLVDPNYALLSIARALSSRPGRTISGSGFAQNRSGDEGYQLITLTSRQSQPCSLQYCNPCGSRVVA